MAIDIQAAITAGLFVREAERVGALGNANSYQPPNGYTIVEAIYANDLQTDISPITDYVAFGFIARSPGPGSDFVVAIRGTNNIWEWVQDARFDKKVFTPVTGAGDTEDGFTDLYSRLRIGPSDMAQPVKDALRERLAGVPNATLTLCGHSLGAAITTLLALDVVANNAFETPIIYTFASPYVGDSLFAATYDRLVPNTWRIANQMDIITHVPPRLFFGYTHVNRGFLVNSAGKVKTDVFCFHHLTTYLYLLRRLVPGEPDITLDAECEP